MQKFRQPASRRSHNAGFATLRFALFGQGLLSCPRGVLNVSESMQKTLVTEETRCKSFASLFKGCGVHGAEPLVACEASETILKIPRQGVNFKTVRWTVLKEGTPWERGRPLVAGMKEAYCCRKAAMKNYQITTTKCT